MMPCDREHFKRVKDDGRGDVALIGIRFCSDRALVMTLAVFFKNSKRIGRRGPANVLNATVGRAPCMMGMND
jgi:hypothetical protein